MSIVEQVNAVKGMLIEIYKAVEETPLESMDDLALALIAIDEMRTECTVVRDFAEQRVVDAMDELPEMEVSGAVLTKRRSDSRKAWSHKELISDLATRLVQSSVDFETGEMQKSTEELITEVLDFAGVSYWKVKALNSVGLSVDDYCEVTEGSMKIRIQRASA